MNIFIRTLLYFCFLGGIATASDLQQQQSALYPFRSTIELSDEFWNGTSSSTAIGQLSWSTSNGSNSFINTPGLVGVLRRDTGAVANTIAYTHSNSAAALVDPSFNHRITWRIRLFTHDATITARLGEADGVALNPPSNGIYFERLSSDTNWHCVTRAAAVQTRTDSGVASTGNFVNLIYKRDSSGVQWYIDGVAVCGTHTTNIPTAMGLWWAQVVNVGVAVTKQLDLDYFSAQYFGLSR